jgi:hypothetical protein
VSEEVYVYLDETGVPDFSQGSGSIFGIGTATYTGNHGQALFEGLSLRTRLEARGVQLPKGLHAKNDSWTTRGEVFDLIAAQKPRFDFSYFTKANAYSDVQQYSKTAFYKLAIFYHLKFLIPRVSARGDEVYLVSGNLQTSNKRGALRAAVTDVCQQIGGGTSRKVTPCIWEAPSAWGIQVADYGLWALNRHLSGAGSETYERFVQPTTSSCFAVWR